MPNTDHSLTFWTQVANTFKSYDYVVFEAFNEVRFTTLQIALMYSKIAKMRSHSLITMLGILKLDGNAGATEDLLVLDLPMRQECSR